MKTMVKIWIQLVTPYGDIRPSWDWKILRSSLKVKKVIGLYWYVSGLVPL